MFQEVISSTQFTSEAANTAMKNISGVPFSSDCSFVSTVRALLYSKIGDNTITIKHSYDGVSSISDFLAEDRDSIFVFRGQESEVPKIGEGWKKVQKVTDFYMKAFKVTCFIHEERKCSLLIVENPLCKWIWHFLQCSIPAFLPWYFSVKEGIGKEEMDLIRSLMQKDSAQYRKATEILYEKSDVRGTIISNMVKSFTNGLDRRMIEEKESSISGLRDRIKRYQDEISSLLSRMYDENITLMGLKSHLGEDRSEFLSQYLNKNDRVILKGTYDGSIDFVVKDYVTYYDQDMMEDCLNNSSSYFYIQTNMSEAMMKKLMTAIFIDKVIKLRVCGAFRISTNGGVFAFTNYNYENLSGIYMPNPHLDNYGCMGDYPRVIEKLIVDDMDYVGAIEQCLASCRNLNFADYTVMEDFSSYIASTEDTILELPDGSIVSPAKALKWLDRDKEES